MKKLLLMLAVFLWSGLQIAMAQSRPVKGQVLDETGEGVPGASVQVKGTTAGTITDADGNFSLEVPDDDNVLVIKAIGYGDQEVQAGDGDNTLNIRLNTTNTQLTETIVTAQAVRREKRSLGYSTTQVGADELTQGGSISPLNSLTGKVAGVNITSTSNTPGASSRIVLRGGSSLTGNNQALIVVDGVIINNANTGTQGNIGNLTNQVDYGNRGNDINPDDVESVSVLKGPAATALYGSKGSNGAIMITTKKGKRKDGVSRTEVEVNSSFSVNSVLKLPSFQDKYGQGDTHGIFDDRRENFSWGLPYNDENRPWGQIIDGQQRVKPYSALPNNVRNFFDVGKVFNNSVAINGGTEKTAFRLSLNSLNSSSIFPGKNYDKYSVNFNGNADLSNKFYASITINYSKIKSDLPGFGQGDGSILDNLYQTPRDIPIRELSDLDNKFNSMEYVDADGITRYGYYGAYAKNPYWVAKNFTNTNKVDRVYGNTTIGYKAFDWLRIEDRIAVDAYSDRRYQTAAKLNSVATDQSLNWLDQTTPGRYSENLINVANIYNDLMITASKNITDDITGSLLLGHNIQQERADVTYASTNEDGGIVVPGFYDLTNSNGKNLAVNGNTVIRRLGIYLDASFGYKNMLFLGFTGRNDWSSTVKNSYFYPSVNGSFVFSELFPAAMKNSAWNYGKFRMSYGRVGNDAPAYQWLQTYGSSVLNGDFGSTIFPLGGVPGFTYNNRVYNPDLKPEFTNEFEVGTEMSFLQDRIRLDFSYYRKRSENQIVPVSLPFSSGFSSQIINTGLVTNNGVELALRLVPVRTSNFRWELFGTFTKNVNEVKEIYPGTSQISVGTAIVGTTVVAAVGKPYGTFYTDGYQKTEDGRYIVDSATGLPLKTTSAQFFGTYLPKWQASWGTTLSYKGFSLYVLFDMKKGGQFFSRTRDIMAFVGTSEETGNRDEQVWPNSVYEGADGGYHTNTTQYDPYTWYTSQAARPGEFQLVDASYVKLREARLSYNLPAKYLNGTPFGNLSLSIFGNNLFLWTPEENKYSDPELNSNGASNVQGFEFGASPSVRSYGINLKVTF
ncbi:MAG: SusC/RagA family TonB-linked outer membrane protein [Taibaiella sp.]|jgi:TonB-linked SusC/RagA family outer membrane protein